MYGFNDPFHARRARYGTAGLVRFGVHLTMPTANVTVVVRMMMVMFQGLTGRWQMVVVAEANYREWV